MNLQKALDLKLVSTKVTSLGRYQGFCIKMELKNLTKDSLIVLVEAGRRLNSLVENEQDILIVQEQFVSLNKLESKSFQVKGYCCQASNRCPQKNSKYDVNKLADSNLVKVARYLNACKFDCTIEQQAVWAISDKKSSATISSITDTTLLPLRQMVANLKGEKLPWYTLISKNYVYSNGAIEVFPIQLMGKFTYSNTKEDYVTLSVIDESGKLVCELKSLWLKACTNQNYNLKLPLKGLAKGRYSVELKTPERQLTKQEFEI